MRTTAVIAILLSTVACASAEVVTADVPVEDPYQGPLYVPVANPDHPNARVSSGAAGQALECAGDPYRGSTGRNWGVSGGHDSATDALDGFVDGEGTTLPAAGYQVEKETDERVLFSYDVKGETKIAIILANGVDEAGWSMETFAQCDPSELPDSVSDTLGVEVWVDERGERVPTTVIRSGRGPEHCEWDSATFLHLNDRTFIKDPDAVLPDDWFDDAFAADVTLPADAEDTGYRLGDQRLWLAADRGAAYVVTEDQTERWPAATGLIGCG